jgi:hypothetical protein
MADEQKPDKAMAGMLKRKSVWPPASGEPGRTASTGAACPDAATLAAYYERSLTAAETSLWETHFSSCARCQEQLAALVRSEPASAAKPASDRRPAFSWLWDWRWMAPVGAAVVILAFFVSFKTMYAPVGSPAGGEVIVGRETARQAPAVSEPQEPAVSASAKTDAVAETAPVAKSLSPVPSKAAAAQPDQALKEKSTAASGAVPSRALPKLAMEEKQVAAAASRVVVAQPATPAVSGAVLAEAAKTQNRIAETDRAKALPAQDAAPAVQSVQKQERAVAAADAKELQALGAAPAPSVPQAKEQATVRKESAAGRQAAADSRFALEAAPQSGSKLRTVPGEFIVATPNSNVLWRLGSSGRIERSRDAGKTWETQKSLAQESFLSGSAPSESICWVGGSNGVLLRTTDGGENWERIPSPTKGDIIAVKASDQSNVTVIGADGRTFETRDAGARWRAR